MFIGTLGSAIADRLPAQPRKGSFDALPYQDVPALMERLQLKTGVAAFALRMLILCASRSGEVRAATDFDRAEWTVPAERMKMRKPHRAPLSPQAIAILEKAAAIRRSDVIFPNGKGAALSDMALTKTLRDWAWTARLTDSAGHFATGPQSKRRRRVKSRRPRQKLTLQPARAASHPPSLPDSLEAPVRAGRFPSIAHNFVKHIVRIGRYVKYMIHHRDDTDLFTLCA